MLLSSWKICCAQVQQRWIFAVMGCSMVSIGYMIRVCLSLAITEMVIRTGNESSSNYTSSDETCPATTQSTSSNSTSSGTYKWDEYTQGIILSSFYWGYVLTQLPGGVLAEKIGGKYTLGFGVLSTAIFTLLIPIVVHAYGATGLIILRILIGCGEGVSVPAISFLIAQWAPPHERSKIGGMMMSGGSLGTVLGNSLSGILLQYSSVGWPIVFYFFGALGVLVFVAWVLLCYSYPAVHPFISENEKKYLDETMNKHTHKQKRPTPWRHVLSSAPLWASIVGKAGYAWGFFTMVTDLPKYMSNVLKFSIQANGFLSALPYVLMWLISIVSSWLADWLIKNEKLSRTNVRKSFATTAFLVPAIFIITASYAGCDRTVVVTCFTIGLGMMGPIYPSLMVNPNDLSPNYSGTLMAIMNSAGALAGIAAPYVVGLLTPNQTISEWRIVFWITFVVFGAITLIFNVWADGEVQYWNDFDLWINQQKEVKGRSQASERDVSSAEQPEQSMRPA